MVPSELVVRAEVVVPHSKRVYTGVRVLDGFKGRSFPLRSSPLIEDMRDGGCREGALFDRFLECGLEILSAVAIEETIEVSCLRAKGKTPPCDGLNQPIC